MVATHPSETLVHLQHRLYGVTSKKMQLFITMDYFHRHPNEFTYNLILTWAPVALRFLLLHCILSPESLAV
jgi:hypothetical protein